MINQFVIDRRVNNLVHLIADERNSLCFNRNKLLNKLHS